MAGVADTDPTELVESLGEKYSFRILRSTVEEPKQATEIIEDHDVPRTTFYRRVDRLVELDLIEEHGEVDLDGSHRTLYECNVEVIRFVAEDDDFRAELELDVDPVERWDTAWDSLRDQTR